MNRINELLRIGPVLVGEVRGTRVETFKRFDKSDKNAPPISFGVFKVNLELLCDGSVAQLSAFVSRGADPQEYAERLALQRGEVVAVNVGRLELKNGQRFASCNEGAIHRLSEIEVAELRSEPGAKKG